MDRFIVQGNKFCTLIKGDLKSNMDRFIGENHNVSDLLKLYLKSNMDRFIVYVFRFCRILTQFKIQYG